MTGWQKFTVLMVGLICIAVICYYFEQAGDSSTAPTAGLTVQQTGASATPVAAGPPEPPRTGDAEQRDRIAMADLVAQFTDMYEKPAQPEPQTREDVLADASDAPASSGSSWDQRPDRPTWDSTPATAGSTAPAAAMVSVPMPQSVSADPTVAAYVPLMEEEAVDTGNEAANPVVAETVVIPQPLETSVKPAASIGTPPPPTVLTVSSNAAIEDEASAVEPGPVTPRDTSRLGIDDYGARNRQTVAATGDRPDIQPPVSTRRPQRSAATTRMAESSWQQTLVEPDPLPVRPRQTSTPSRTTARRTYTVQSGDTFSSIAITVFGTERRYIDIVNANPDIDPRRLKVGQVINLPGDGPSIGGSRVASTAQPKRSVRYHVVGVGDNLSNIAHRYYKDASKWQQIHKANRDLIGPNPNKLKAGMKLTIPTM